MSSSSQGSLFNPIVSGPAAARIVALTTALRRFLHRGGL